MDFSNRYIVGFALALCLVCSLAVSSTAVALKDRQEANKKLDMQTQILRVAGLLEADASPTAEEAEAMFADVETLLIDTKTGDVIGPAEDIDPGPVIKAAKNSSVSTETTSTFAKGARLGRIPNELKVMKITSPGNECYVFLIWGNGLWSTMYGYIALEPDLQTVKGITFYEHGETPGLGGEIDNPRWKERWNGKLVYNSAGEPALNVTKGGMAKDANHDVDGISGATITSVAVGYTVQTWLGEEGFGAFIKKEAK
ncbi:MAG: NADH:ubiquinone reductase (Na(+)-transporting) subunit C [Planctomycetes bacterium]|nr:NADH:ubiquinone reductase (Na(+)-transporting) subunit C [Planctomycetota bacterium]MCP4770503.1 NADH:ubiquinone reductase (Na(+)-transporting) subunit C [Planctomycetota bacterium]MCP4859943.1 NADH:ubiquinone reductase (Na(+)-transporting) subunit C [Planctomycetota bacterium]